MRRVLLCGFPSCEASILLVAGCARERRELPGAPTALGWSAVRHQYETNLSSVHEMHPLIFDGSMAKLTDIPPQLRADEFVLGAVALQVVVVRVVKGRLPVQRFSVAVSHGVDDDLGSAHRSKVMVFKQGGTYRFFCDSETLEHAKTVLAEAIFRPD